MIKGRRLVIWIPKEELWIFDVLEYIQRKAEREGIPLSQADIVRLHLAPVLAPYLDEKKDDSM